jgi:hypothetical protein
MPVTVITGTKFTSTLGYAPRTTSDVSTPGTLEPMACMYRTINVVFNTPLLDPVITLCQNPADFVVRDTGPLEGTFGFVGYMAQGTLAADPTYLIGQQYAGQFTAVFGTGNTLIWSGKVTNDAFTFTAKDNSGRQTNGIFSGTPTATWVVAAANRAAVRAKMLKDREKFGDEAVPMSAIVKTSNDELTKRLTLGEVAAAVTQQPRFIARLLREQAAAAGSDPALVDEIRAFDQYELAGLLTNEAVLELPLLLPLSRHRARAAERTARFQAMTTKRRETLAAIVSKMPSVPPSFGTPSASATAA